MWFYGIQTIGLGLGLFVLEAEVQVSLTAIKIDVDVAATFVSTVTLFAFALFLTATVDQAPNKAVFAKKAGQNITKDTLVFFLLLAFAAALPFAAVANVDGPVYGHSLHSG